MVFGIFDGKVEVLPDKASFVPGEKIKGTIKLHLKHPIKGKRLVVELLREEVVPTQGMTWTTAWVSVDKHSSTVKRLGSEKLYNDGDEYRFEFQLLDIQASKKPNFWCLAARLDLPEKHHIDGRMQIFIEPRGKNNLVNPAFSPVSIYRTTATVYIIILVLALLILAYLLLTGKLKLPV